MGQQWQRRRYGAGVWLTLPVLFLVVAGATSAAAAGATIFDRTFTRQTGPPNVSTFSVAAQPGIYTLQIDSSSLASAVVTLNGVTVVAPRDFNTSGGRNGDIQLIERQVQLIALNRFTVELRSQPGATLRLRIIGTDSDPPTIQAEVSPAPNAFGWHKSDVTVNFRCSDAGTGIQTCPAPVHVTAEGAGQVITGTATDNGGNSTSTSVTINLDKTAPLITQSTSPEPNAHGWTNADTMVRFTCTDALSGVASCSPPHTVTTEGAGQSVAGAVADRAGNEAAVTASVSVDKTAPIITAAAGASPTSHGWYGSAVTVNFTCEDNLSTALECPAAVPVDGEGSGQTITGVVRDDAGNAAEASVTVNVDLTPPRMTATLSSEPNSFGWHHEDVTVTFVCEDVLAGVDVCPAAQTVSVEAEGHEVTAAVTDRAGHRTTITVPVSLDKTAPTISAATGPAPNAAGWNNTPATVTFSCADPISGIVDCSVPVVVSEDASGRIVTGTATDRAGNSASVDATVNVDLTPPIIRAIPSAAGPTNADVTVRFECEDVGSRVAQCPAPVTVTTEGSTDVEGVATDVAGNGARAQLSVTIDRTGPTLLAAASPAPNGAGWHNVPVVTVTFICNDTGTGIASCPSPVDVAAEGRNQIVSGTATDLAGNIVVAQLTVNIDRTPPSITPTPSAMGWANRDVSVQFACADALSGVADCAEPIVLHTDGAHEVSGAAVDIAGNVATSTVTVMVDKTAPAIVAMPDRDPNAAAWYNAPVTVRFICTDEASGVASCPEPTTLTSNGAGQTVSGTATDRAGNAGTAALIVNIDTIAPVLRIETSPGWASADVTVNFVCEDEGGSGVALCPAQRVVSAEGATLIEATVTDRAGNSATAAATVQVDRTPPTIAATATSAPNAEGWYRQPVRVEFTCSDGISPIASCSGPVEVVVDGAGQVVTGTAIDAAGNRASSSLTINLDTTPPAIAAVSDPAGAWTNTNVTVSYLCSDAVSGVAACPELQTVTTEGAGQLVEGQATDRAGNVAIARTTVNIDRTPPTIQTRVVPEPNARGWHNGDVTVQFECADAASGIALCPSAATPGGEGAGLLVSGTARDAVGNTATAEFRLNVDRTPPSVQITSPAAGATVRTASVPVSGNVADAVSHVASVMCGSNRAVLSDETFACSALLSTGSNAVPVVATDEAGNTTSLNLPLTYDANATPIARAGGPYSGETGQTIKFDGSTSADPDGQPLTFLWTFGDGGTATGAAPTHVYANAGTHTVELRVTDAQGASNSTLTTATILLANRTPTAVAGGPYSGDAVQAITFNGSGSSDSDGDTLSYTWNFGDGSTASGAIVRRAYTTSGTYTVTLTVDDGRGGRHVATTAATVRPINQKPTARIGGPYSTETGRAVSFNGSASSDPDNDALTFTWNFGDGSTGTGPAPLHSFASSGAFTATLTVDDGRGGIHSASTLVDVVAANQQPTARIEGPSSGRIGDALAFDAVGSTDPDNDPLTYSWSFGDGRGATGAGQTHAYTTAGTFTVALVVNDGRGGMNRSTTAVTIEAAADNRAPLVSAGGPYAGEVGLPVAFDASASSDPDNEALSYAWEFGDGHTGSGPTPMHTYAEAREYIVTVTATDARGAAAQATAAAMIGPRADRAPPIVSVYGPREVLPGTSVTVRADASDNTGVASVAFEVDGTAGAPINVPPFEHTIQIPAVASPGETIAVRAVARDVSGNQATADIRLTIAIQPDNEPPSLELRIPSEGAPGSSLRLAAAASDNDAVASVAFSVNGLVLLTDLDAPFEMGFAIPADAPIGSSLQISAEATDYTGNRASTTGTVAIAAQGDTTPPALTLDVPSVVAPGGTIFLRATATDDSGVAAVVFTIDGARVAAITQPPYEARYEVPATAVPGMMFRVEVRATDFAGLETSASAHTQLLAAQLAGGLVVGEVYDDATGLPLGGATVALGSGENDEDEIITDARGRYALRMPPGPVNARISRDGFTTVRRAGVVSEGGVTALLDARLTPLSPNSRDVASLLGGTLESTTARLSLPEGALGAQATLTLTPISAQGLAALLPPGWAPAAAVEITPRGLPFSIPGSLRMTLASAPAAGTELTLATWDDQSRGWRAVAQTTADGSASAFEAAVDATGQFVWLRRDRVPAAPPDAIIDELLTGVTASEVPAAASTVITPRPQIIFYQPGVQSKVQGALTTPAPLPSGTVLWSRIAESYRYYSGAEIHPDGTIQDLIFYQSTDDGSELSAAYTATPSRTFEPLTLERGVIGLELLAPPQAGLLVAMIGAAGGGVTADTGERLEFPAGPGSGAFAASLRRVSAGELGLTLPDGLEFIGAVEVMLDGAAPSVAGTLSIPRPPSFSETAQILVARVATVQERTRLVLVARGRAEGDRLLSDAMLPLNRIEMEGVRSAGRYVFLRPETPVGFVAGHVLGADGSGFTGAQVSVDTVPLVALSREASGAYVAAAAVGPAALVAVDLQTSDEGAGGATIEAADEELAVDLRLVPAPPRVVSVTPASAARNVPVSTAVVVAFSESIDVTTISGSGASNLTLTDASGTALAGVLSLSGANTVATFRPAESLQPNARYTLSVTARIRDVSGYQLATPLEVSFTTLDTTAPPPPPAGSLTAGIPDAGGTTTIRASQGTAGLHDTVSIENITRGTSTPVLLDPNGGFIVLVQATANDRLKMKIVDQAGNETLVAVPGFTRQNADGSISGVVGSAGGHITGPEGTAVDVPANSLPEGTIVTIKSIVAEANFPVQLTAAQHAEYAFARGVEIDFGGATPAKYVNVSVPAHAGAKPDDQWVVALVRDLNGAPLLHPVDTAKLIDGSVQTSSPPCPGVTGAGVYGIYKANRPVGVNFAQMYQKGFYNGLRLGVEYPPLISGLGFLAPFAVLSYELPHPVCLPVLTGRVTAGQNTIRIKLAPDALTPADREIVVKNLTAQGKESHFRRDVLEYAFEVPGTERQAYEAFVVPVQGGPPVRVTAIDVKPGPPGNVIVTLDADSITVAVSEVVVRNVSVEPADEHRFRREEAAIELPVGGGVTDRFWITAVDADGVSRPLAEDQYTKLPSPHGQGNMLAKALDGTIDPTRAEMEVHNAEVEAWNAAHPDEPPRKKIYGRARSRVDLVNETQQWRIPIPEERIVNGGFAYPFQGEDWDQYAIEVFYNDELVANDDGTESWLANPFRDYQKIVRLTLIVSNPQTGKVIKTIQVQAPPRDEPLGIGVITDDTQPPLMTASPSRLDSFDPTSPLTFTFNEAMNPLSVKQGAIVEVIKDGARGRLFGEWRVHDSGRKATFVPDAPLRVGQEYSITFVGADALGERLMPGVMPITDLGGNGMATMRLRLKTFAPRIVARVELGKDGRLLDEVRDIQIRRKTVDQRQKTFLFATTNGAGGQPKVLSFDVTDTEAPAEVGFYMFGGNVQKELFLIPDVGKPGRPRLRYRLPSDTEPEDAGEQGCRSSSPDGTEFVGDLGITAGYNVDLSFVQFWNFTDPANPCMLASKLLTANPDSMSSHSSPGTIHASGFAEGVVAIPHSTGIAAFVAVREIGVMPADIGQNIPGRTPAERIKEGVFPGDYWDLVATQDRLVVANNAGKSLDIFDPNGTQLGTVALSESPRELVVAERYGSDDDGDGFIRPTEMRDLAFVSTNQCVEGACSASIQIVDLKGFQQPEVVGRIPMPDTVLHLDIDEEKKRLFAAGYLQTPFGRRSGFFIIDISRPTAIGADSDQDGLDDRIIWTHEFPYGLNAPRIDKERGVAYIPTIAENGVRKGRLEIWALYDNCCDLGVDLTAKPSEKPTGDREGLLRKEREALQAGIAKGLQKAEASCGLAASAISMLEQGSGACLWGGSGSCDDNYQPGLSDHDFEVFFPEAAFDQVGACTVTKLNEIFTNPATDEPNPIALPGGGTIAFEDITFFPEVKERFETARFDVEPPASAGGDATGDMGLGRRSLLLKWLLEGAYVTGVPGYSLSGRSLDAILNDLKTVTGIPQLEGFEWSTLQEAALAKSKAFLRVVGASDPASAFHKTFIKQLHDAGKAGIRATMARMAADPGANRLVLDVTRGSYQTNACLDIDRAVPTPRSWRQKPCSSFEEYVASAAARTLRETPALRLFTVDEVVSQVNRFFRVKSDRERIINERAADAFIALTAQFITRAKDLTRPAYDANLPSDPDRAQRISNLAAAQAATASALANADLVVEPRVFNFGFRNGTNLRVVMYRADAEGGGEQIGQHTVDLAGGETRHLKYVQAGGTVALSGGRATPIFVVRGINLTAGFGQPRGIAFTIDLPDRTMKEANRENNVGGFFYYVLDRGTGATPDLPPEVPFPLPNRQELLQPSPECYDTPAIVVSQSVEVGGEQIRDLASLGRGEAVTIRLTVQNLSSEPLHDVIVCSNITNQCYSIGAASGNETALGGSLRPGEPVTHVVQYVTPDDNTYIDGGASVFSPSTGVIAGPEMRVIVSGDAYAIQPLMDEEVVRSLEADTDEGRERIRQLFGLEAGGKLHRHFRIVGKRSGQPKPNLTVSAELEGFFGASTGTRPLTFKTDGHGEICAPVGGACSEDERGLVIPYDRDMVSNTTYFVRLKQVDGRDISEENRTEFDFDLMDRAYTQSYAVGGQSGAGLRLFVAGGDLEYEDGFELTKSGHFFTGPKKLDLGLSHQVTARGNGEVEFSLGISTPLVQAKASAKGGATVSAPLSSYTDGFSFQYQRNADPRPDAPAFILEHAAHCAIARLTTRHMSQSSPIISKLADLLYERPCGNPERFATSHGTRSSISLSGSVGLEVGLQSPILGGVGGQRPTLGVSGSASATGSVSVEHETSLKYEDDALQVEGAKTGVGLFGQFELSGGLGLTLEDAYKLKPGLQVVPSEEDRREDFFAVKSIKKALSISGSRTTGGALSVSFAQDADGTPKEIGLSFANPKEWGWNASAGGGGAGINLGRGYGSSISYTIKREEDVGTAVERLANLQALADSLEGRVAEATELSLGASQINEQMALVRTLLFDTVSTYQITSTEGQGLELPFGFEGKLGRIGLSAKLSFKGDSKTTFVSERGINYKGRQLPLQSYTRDQYLPAADMGLTDALAQMWESVEASFESEFSYVGADIAQGSQAVLRSTRTATMTIDGNLEPEPFSANLYSYTFRPIAGPAADVRRLPSDTAGAADAPHYGIGGFHHFAPHDRQLAAPVPLVIDYRDVEVEGLDESTLAIYAWNDTTIDWDYIGGTVNAGANTVTAMVDRLRTYTLAPAMPARRATLTGVDEGTSGAGPTATRRFTVTSGPLVMNNGQPVAEGTLFTVRSVFPGSTEKVPYGRILTADADPARDNVQVPVAGGRLQFEVEYDTPNDVYLPGQAVVYSTAGTAHGDAILVPPPTP